MAPMTPLISCKLSSAIVGKYECYHYNTIVNEQLYIHVRMIHSQ